MDYQEIITAYKKKDLDTSNLRKKLEVAKPLKGRERYRAVYVIDNSLSLNNKVVNLLTMPENMEKADEFLNSLDDTLNEYFSNLITSIKNCKAWDVIGLIPKGWSQAEFETLSNPNKFKILYDINKKYYKFLEYQKIADIRDLISPEKELTDDKINKLEFLISMFNSFKNENIKDDFFCLDKKFLMTLINFRRSKQLRIEEFMKTKKKNIQYDYEKYSMYFSTEDFRDIIDNLLLTSKTLKISLTKTIDAFYELSESESEKSHLKWDFEELKKVQKKYVIMNKLKAKLDKINEEKALEEKKKNEEKQRLAEIQERIKQKALAKEKAERDRIIGKEEGYSEGLPNDINKNNSTVLAKEQVIPMIFTWFEKEDTTLTRRISSKKLMEFFDKIKMIEEQSGTRVSLFLVTNTNKEVTLKRLQDIQKKAKAYGLPRLVEAGFGGYSTFKIDNDGKVTDIAQMSELNRTKIVNLLEKPMRYSLTRNLIDESEQNYLRYQFSDKKNKHITSQYLRTWVNEMLENEQINKQPLKFLPYIEKNCSGIDVVLESQLKGISQLSEYYKSKYYIKQGKILKADVVNIDTFLKDYTPAMKTADIAEEK